MKGGTLRSLEDPLQSLFDLSDEVYRTARWSLTRIYVTILFIVFSLFFTIILLAVWLTSGEFALFILFLGFLIAGIMALQTIVRMRTLFREFVIKHAAINAVKEDPIHRVPRGRTPAMRFITHLRERNRSFDRLISEHPEILDLKGSLAGATRHHLFDAHVIVRKGKGKYLLLVRSYMDMPDLEDFRKLHSAVEDIYHRLKIVPSRVAMVVHRPSGDLSDDVYRAVLAPVPIGGTTTTFQIAIESMDGTYDFIPMIPELRGFMP